MTCLTGRSIQTYYTCGYSDFWGHKFLNPQQADVSLHTLHSVNDSGRGSLCVAEQDKDVPFPIQRVFYLHDLPEGIERARHAHRFQDEFLICLGGKVEVTTIRGQNQRHFTMSRPDEGLYLPSMTWISIKVLSAMTTCLVLCSGLYNESDYIRNYAHFEVLQKN